MKDTHIVYISVGSNMGDRKANCVRGIAALSLMEGTQVTGESRFYETEPVGFRDQDWFVNAAVVIETVLDSFQLLTGLKRIEASVGRKDTGVRFGPRVLDLDIIFFDEEVINTPCLIIPHPRMHERRFVLRPICDIDPHVGHPVIKKTAREILDGLQDDDQQQVVNY